jgi:hypothetical protein
MLFFMLLDCYIVIFFLSLQAVLYSIGPTAYTDHLHDVCLSLCKDESPIVRKTLASCLHELAWIIGPEKSSQIFLSSSSAAAWQKLGRDFDFSVRQTWFEYLPNMLQVWRQMSNADDYLAVQFTNFLLFPCFFVT